MLLSMFNCDALLIWISVRSIPCYPMLSHVILGYLILQMGYLDSWTLVKCTSHNLSCSVKLDLDLLKPWRVSAAAAARDEDGSSPVKHIILVCPSNSCLRSGSSMPTASTIQHSSGCPPSLQSGLPTTDMSLEDAWHARPQLFFKCLLRPRNGRPPKNPSWTRDPMTW